MKRIIYSVFLALSSGAIFGQNVFLTEHFNYPADSFLTANGWYAHSGIGNGPIKVTNGGLSWSQTNYFGSGVGNAAHLDTTGSDENRPLSNYIDSGNVYISFLVRVNGQIIGGTGGNSGYFLHTGQYSNTGSPIFSDISTAHRARTYIAPGSSADKFRFGITFNSATVPSNVGVDVTSDLDTGQTYLLVLKYSFIPGASNDSVSLFVFTDGSNILSEPATPTLGPLGGTAVDASIVQYVALRQYSPTQNIIVDGIIVQDSWNLAPPPMVGPTLLTPLDNTVLNISGMGTTLVDITWTTPLNAGSSVSYEWQLDARAVGTFANPLLAFPSNNGGSDTVLTLSYGQIDAALGALGVPLGGTAEAVWRVRAISGTDTAYSIDVFDIDVVRGVITNPLAPFNLLSPGDQASINVTGAGTQTAIISWNSTSAGGPAVEYRWLAILPGGNFNSPLLNLLSDGMGADTNLTLSFSALDSVLAWAGIAVGDSVTLEWTVQATANSVNLLASQVWQITIVRGGLISIEESNLDNQIRVYPNPASGIVNIQFGQVLVDDLNLSVINQIGQEVLSIQNLNSSLQIIPLDLSDFENGIYYVRVYNRSESVVHKIVLQR